MTADTTCEGCPEAHRCLAGWPGHWLGPKRARWSAPPSVRMWVRLATWLERLLERMSAHSKVLQGKSTVKRFGS